MKEGLTGVIVGCGRAAVELQLGAFRENRASIVAMCDVDLDLARETARREGVPHAYATLEEALEKHQGQFVSICTPPATHFELSKLSLEAGCHVLLEKPAVLDVAELEKLEELREQQDRKLVVVHNHKFLPGPQQAFSLAKSGVVGDVLHATIHMLYDPNVDRMMFAEHWSHQLPGGRLMEGLPHAIYTAYNLIGELSLEHVVARPARNSTWPFLQCDEIAVTLTSGDAIATIVMSMNMERSAPGNKGGFNGGFVAGSRAMFVYDYGRARLYHTLVARPTPTQMARQGVAVARDIARRVVRRLPRATTPPRTGSGSGHDKVIEGFVNHLRLGTPPPTTYEEAHNTARIWWEIGKECERLGILPISTGST